MVFRPPFSLSSPAGDVEGPLGTSSVELFRAPNACGADWLRRASLPTATQSAPSHSHRVSTVPSFLGPQRALQGAVRTGGLARADRSRQVRGRAGSPCEDALPLHDARTLCLPACCLISEKRSRRCRDTLRLESSSSLEEASMHCHARIESRSK
jgi:hypothetical protein